MPKKQGYNDKDKPVSVKGRPSTLFQPPSDDEVIKINKKPTPSNRRIENILNGKGRIKRG